MCVGVDVIIMLNGNCMKTSVFSLDTIWQKDMRYQLYHSEYYIIMWEKINNI